MCEELIISGQTEIVEGEKSWRKREKRKKRDVNCKISKQRTWFALLLSEKLKLVANLLGLIFTTGLPKSHSLMWYVKPLQCWRSDAPSFFLPMTVNPSRKAEKRRHNFPLKHFLHPELHWSCKFLTGTLTGALAILSEHGWADISAFHALVTEKDAVRHEVLQHQARRCSYHAS